MKRSKSNANFPPLDPFSHVPLTLRDCIYFTVVLIAVLMALDAEARPEFALKTGINRCTVCHYSPAGGGPRNLNGKYFRSVGYKLSKWSAQPYAGADVKFLYYESERHSDTKGGLATMAGSVWAAIPLIDDPEARFDTRVVGEQNIGGFTAGQARNLYLQYSLRNEQKTSILPQHILFGRMIPPFGLMTDEHRTYVRMQTGSTWNADMRIGLLLAANPVESLHYDLAVFNYNSAAASGTSITANGRASQWGYLGNLRFMPSRLGALMGLSASYYEADSGTQPRYAQSIYSALSIDRWTGHSIPVTLKLEYALARNWNGAFTSQFVSDTAVYGPSVEFSRSQGVLVGVDYDLTDKVQLNYKYDNLILDRDYPADVYQRHGFGMKHYFGPNMWFLIRYEKASSGRPNEEAGTGAGALNAFWTVVSLGI